MRKIISQKTLFVIIFSLIFAAGFNLRAQTFGTAAGTSKTETGKTPIIIIPGLTGSELVNKNDDSVVWFRRERVKGDDLRLPISPDLKKNYDDLIVKDVIRNVQIVKLLPEIEIYERLTDALQSRGYSEGNIDTPPEGGDADRFYIFAYDWRRDNVENSRLLLEKIDALKQKLKRPDLKFNVIAHSMGGLIARYAAMYGAADLPKIGLPRLNWAGAKNFNKIILLGTPNEGSVESLETLLNGFSYIGGGLNLPFVQNLSKFDLFTIPSIYQLLPSDDALKVYDEKLKPIKLDIYNVKTWKEYDWDPIQDDDFARQFTPEEIKAAPLYLTTVLNRAKRFHQALDAKSRIKIPLTIYLVGGDCKDTPGAILLYRSEKKDKWKTLFKGESFKRADGTKISGDEISPLLLDKGDGVVTKTSLTAAAGGKSILPAASKVFVCEGHTKLVTSPEAQDKVFALLNGNPPKP